MVTGRMQQVSTSDSLHSQGIPLAASGLFLSPASGDQLWQMLNTIEQMIFMVLCNGGYQQFTVAPHRSMCSPFIVV